MNINKKLDTWVEHKLLTEKQKDKIVEFEHNAKRPALLYALLFLSTFCIGLGLIAIIASNWQIIPANSKLFCAFASMLIVIYGIFESNKKQKTILRESLIFVYALISLGTIGLIAQIYHIPSKGLTGIFFWSIITLPLAFMSKKPLFPFLWIGAFTISFFEVIYRVDWVHHYVRELIEDHFIIAILALIYILALKIEIYGKFFKEKFSSLFSASQAWLIVLMVVITLLIDFTYFNYGYYRNAVIPSWVYNIVWLSLLAMAVGIFILKNHGAKKYMGYALAALLIFSYSEELLLTKSADEMIGAICTFTMLGLTAAYAYKTSNTRLVNIASIFIAIRFFIIYIQVFGSLLTTGFGLIISGIFLLLIAYAWQKARQKLISSIKGAK